MRSTAGPRCGKARIDAVPTNAWKADGPPCTPGIVFKMSVGCNFPLNEPVFASPRPGRSQKPSNVAGYSVGACGGTRTHTGRTHQILRQPRLVSSCSRLVVWGTSVREHELRSPCSCPSFASDIPAGVSNLLARSSTETDPVAAGRRSITP
jgi:hypothetical protein